jgi:predicted nucleotidyltransferase
MQWTAKAILNTLSQHRRELQQVGVRRIGLFGSYIRGDESESSDMDFLVTFDRNTFDAYDNTRVDAVVRNLQIIGEAVKTFLLKQRPNIHLYPGKR